jgi:hypothetical protein
MPCKTAYHIPAILIESIISSRLKSHTPPSQRAGKRTPPWLFTASGPSSDFLGSFTKAEKSLFLKIWGGTAGLLTNQTAKVKFIGHTQKFGKIKPAPQYVVALVGDCCTSSSNNV